VASGVVFQSPEAESKRHSSAQAPRRDDSLKARYFGQQWGILYLSIGVKEDYTILTSIPFAI